MVESSHAGRAPWRPGSSGSRSPLFVCARDRSGGQQSLHLLQHGMKYRIAGSTGTNEHAHYAHRRVTPTPPTDCCLTAEELRLLDSGHPTILRAAVGRSTRRGVLPSSCLISRRVKFVRWSDYQSASTCRATCRGPRPVGAEAEAPTEQRAAHMDGIHASRDLTAALASLDQRAEEMLGLAVDLGHDPPDLVVAGRHLDRGPDDEPAVVRRPLDHAHDRHRRRRRLCRCFPEARGRRELDIVAQRNPRDPW